MNIIAYLKQHQLLALLIFVITFMVVVTVSVLVLQTNPTDQSIQKSGSTPVPVSNTMLEESGILYGTSDQAKDLLVSILPPTTEALTPGKTETFVLTFKENVTTELKAKVVFHSILDDSDQEVPFKLLIDQNRMSISLNAPIVGYGEYTLSINSVTEELFSVTYLSDVPRATPVANNNLALIEYLPFETNTFRLTFIPNQNKYLFSYKFDINSTKEAGVQYDEAKEEALQFIRNRGIDPNTLVIEWSFH